MTLPVIRQKDLKTYQIVATSTEHVYKSTYELTGRCVFIKLLSLADRTERQRKEILREVEFIGRIKSEHLTETLGIYRTSNTIGIVTEWMSNLSLHSLIYQRDLYPELPLSICIRLLADVAEGLCFLHNLNPPVRHQRLKPCNVLLDAQYRAKLSDFWLSEQQKVSVSQNKDDNASLVYLSPQRLQRQRPTKEDDIYSFGMLLYESLSRQRPFLENNPLKLETEIIRGIRPQPHIDVILKATDLPHTQRTNLNQLINVCWHQNPNRRPSAAECLSRLRSVQQTFSSAETERDVHALWLEKERATQHSQTCEVEYNIIYLDEGWTTNSNRSRTQSAPEESIDASSLCPGTKKEQRSVIGPAAKRVRFSRSPCLLWKVYELPGPWWTLTIYTDDQMNDHHILVTP
ncbi:receptor-interacting serine/threonine-protein kinase 2-like isoform X2 [Pseudophryne corroboree]|uniref:receptor-interacting serine/threonine-protein kinase 2-like isoform X2 n=1 Tax=Pseudophryne corroboree TaxID=495146 RepID=UPI003081749A